MARNDPQVNIRLPAELIDRLENAASSNQRAFKAEIVARLERTFAMDAANEEIYQRLSRGEPPENPPPPVSEDAYGVELPHFTDPAVSELEAEFHQEMDLLTRRMASKLAKLRAAGPKASVSSKGRDGRQNNDGDEE